MARAIDNRYQQSAFAIKNKSRGKGDIMNLKCMFKSKVYSLALAFILCPATNVLADTSAKSGDYTVYYNAFTSDSLQPSMARAYKITRSKNRGLLSISVLKKSLSPVGVPVKAAVNAKASNLTGQLKTIDIREVEDGNSVYYLSEFHISHKEILDFTLNIKPEGSDESITVTFRQQFYTN